jgi:hypothetical protein
MYGKGQTTRLVLRAAEALSAGYNVTVVGLTRPDAVAICRRVLALAKGLKIPCRNVVGGDPEGPWVRPRALDEAPPLPTPAARVFIDHRAVHERQNSLPTRVRSVIA